MDYLLVCDELNYFICVIIVVVSIVVIIIICSVGSFLLTVPFVILINTKQVWEKDMLGSAAWTLFLQDSWDSTRFSRVAFEE
jgi:hypothetical protein